MWILVEVDDPRDVGRNEKARYLLHGKVVVPHGPNPNRLPDVTVIEGTRVHPATPGDVQDDIKRKV